jgi:tRNA modification GTPase
MLFGMDSSGNDTIAAVSTAPGRAALAVVRISGSRAVEVADRIFRGRTRPSEMSDHTVQHGYVVTQRGQAVDEAMLTVLRGPRSFTGEDTVEITCHGGGAAAPAVVELAVLAGARPASPGEFTLRAYLNGRLDLSQAEAVADVIEAGTLAAARAALERLEGGLSRRIGGIRSGLLEVLAQLEAAVDFPEDDLPQPVVRDILEVIEGSAKEISRVLEESRTARLLRDGAKAVISGRPNTGKSSLFNLLLRQERAIVTEQPGTTRDVLEGFIEVRGLPVRLFDTAGVREPADQIEAIGVERAREKMEQADLVLLVIDGSKPPRPEDKRLLEQTRNLARIVVLNKNDLKPAFTAQKGWVRLSAVTGAGLSRLEEAMVAALTGGRGAEAGGAAAANARQVEALRRSKELLAEAARGMSERKPYDLLAGDVRASVAALDEITGEAYRRGDGGDIGAEVLERIFERFCIGK